MLEPCYVRQPDLGLIRVTGADARGFLHAQTTQDLAGLGASGVRRAAWLSAKGRVRALFDVVAEGAGLWLVLPADNAGYLATELERYVLRSDVSLEPADDRAVYSVCGESAEWLGAEGIRPEPGEAAVGADALWYALGPRRVDVIGPAAAAPAPIAGLAGCRPDLAALEGIALGLPQVTAALRERYLPQMLNLDRLDAVSFTKGCYPGQEIVARTTNLGEVKRRLARFALGAGVPPPPGAEIVDVEGRPAGEVNLSARTGTGFDLLAVVSLAAARDALRLAADGRELEPRPLPDTI